MARTIARANTASKQLDRKYLNLEARLDKGTKHLRQYNSDLKDIRALLENGQIDKAHAEIWAKKAKALYDQIEDKIEEKRKENNPTSSLPQGSWWSRVFGD